MEDFWADSLCDEKKLPYFKKREDKLSYDRILFPCKKETWTTLTKMNAVVVPCGNADVPGCWWQSKVVSSHLSRENITIPLEFEDVLNSIPAGLFQFIGHNCAFVFIKWLKNVQQKTDSPILYFRNVMHCIRQTIYLGVSGSDGVLEPRSLSCCWLGDLLTQWLI